MSCLRCAVIFSFLAAVPATSAAQVYASEHGVVAQTVSGVVITVEYYRPKARGRELFGKLVPWGRVWTPGANWATTLEVDHDVSLEGQPLPKGKYSLWAIPGADQWTVVVNRTARAFHTRPPAADDAQLRFTVTPVQGPHVEMLTWSFPEVSKNAAELHLQWGTMDVPLHVGIGQSLPAAAALTETERRKLVGTYRMTHLGPMTRIKTSTYTVFDSAGVLRLRRSDPPDTFYDAQFDLHPTAEHTFVPIMYRSGALIGAEPAMTIRFTFEGDRATGVETYFATGGVMARGVLERP